MDEIFPIERSDYLRHRQVERAAIDTHKWLLSEQVGRDVGWDYAQWNWIMAGHRARWLIAHQSTGSQVQHSVSDSQ